MRLAAPVSAAEGQKPSKGISFSFEGAFGTFDRQQLQRGYKVYKEVCANCHSMRLVSFRNLSGRRHLHGRAGEGRGRHLHHAGWSGRCNGDMFERPGLPSDRSRRPLPMNRLPLGQWRCLSAGPVAHHQVRPGWYGTFNQLVNGIGGPKYVYSVLTGYEDRPAELAAEAPEGKSYNPYFGATATGSAWRCRCRMAR
jgi:ubiquinol-cytochrome c reductase cytochrome c1 subunit